ncbi:hypothetical protein [Saccharomonospora saliphila]|uniref:hypothetical protein n=1 Tax=Saccharomonospora saliphila TaxID=369829 RepID=UPI0003641728|nr:hypothetical protein [Saccharomonospora saliphila]
MSAVDSALSTYLNDHYAAAVAATELTRRMAAARRDAADAAEFAALADGAAEHLRALRAVLSELDIPVRRYKATAAWAGEKLGRLKLNGRLLSGSPSSPVVELDGLAMLLTARAAVWRALLAVARHDGRLDERELIEAVGRAENQAESVRVLHTRYAEAGFAPAHARRR